MKRLLALPIVMSSMFAMEPQTNRLDITWKEVIAIGQTLYNEHGPDVDLHELIMNDVLKPVPLAKTDLMPLLDLPKQESIPRVVRRNTNEKISAGLKSAYNVLLGIRKISSSP